MNFSLEQILIIFGILLLSSVFASKISFKLGIPTLILFISIGMLAGSQGIGGLKFENYHFAQYIGESSLIIILFAGGLGTEWQKIRPILSEGLLLSSLGVLLTTLSLGTFAWFLLGSFSSIDLGTKGITWIEALLIGAIVSSTDAAAVFSVLKSAQVKLKNNLQPLLELESGSNDPIAILLVTQIVDILIHGDFSLASLIINLVIQISLGLIFGYGWGIIMVQIIRSIRLNAEGLYLVCSLALLFLTYGTTSYCQGNPFLAIYISGIVLRYYKVKNYNLITSFHEGLSWLMEITMFLMLGLLVFPSSLLSIAPISIVLGLFLLLVARPLSVFICLIYKKYTTSEKLFISWVGLRGAVPIILSLIPIMSGVENAEQIFNIMFFLVIISILIQGLSLAPMAKFLKVISR